MRVTLCDVGPRDGLQNEADVFEPATRAELVNRLAAAGLPRVEAVSFVRDDRVPAMAGAEQVVAGILPRAGTKFAALVLNERGFERFRASPLDRVNVTLGATESFNQANGNATLADAVERAEAILGRVEGTVPISVTISVCFGCPFEGHVDPGVVVELAARFAGRAEVVLADTIGVATPSAVRALVAQAGASRLPRPQHAEHRLRELPRRGRGGGARPRRIHRRPRAVARMPRVRPGTSQPRISSTSSKAKASRRASTSTR